MTEPTRPTMPAEPVAPPIVAEYFNRYREFYRDTNRLEPLLPYPDRENALPNVRLIGDPDPERHSYGPSSPEIRFSQGDRLERFRQIAEEQIAQIRDRVQLAEQLVDYFECHEAEILAYNAAHDDWRNECDRLEREYYQAKQEHANDLERARFTVGSLVREYRGRKLWQIVARDGKGAVMREFDYYDGAKNGSKVVADVFPLDLVGFREIVSAA